jgi:H+/Cl- antiporter ClcA
VKLAVLSLAAVQLACASSHRLAAGIAPADSISETEIQSEMRTMPSSVAAPVLLGVVGGAAGFVFGGWVGYQIDYRNDLHSRGCEDCGLGGLIVGAAVGLPTGVAGGVLLGTQIAREHQRAQAIRRIRSRRSQ